MGGPPSREAWPPQTRPRPSELLPPGEAGYPLTQEDSEGLRRKVEGGKVIYGYDYVYERKQRPVDGDEWGDKLWS